MNENIGISDALIKEQLSGFEFAKNNNLVQEYLDHEINIMAGVIKFARDVKKMSSDEVILGNSCHLAVANETSRVFRDQFFYWYEAGKRIGQFTFAYDEFIDFICAKYEGWYSLYGEVVSVYYVRDGWFEIDTD